MTDLDHARLIIVNPSSNALAHVGQVASEHAARTVFIPGAQGECAAFARRRWQEQPGHATRLCRGERDCQRRHGDVHGVAITLVSE